MLIAIALGVGLIPVFASGLLVLYPRSGLVRAHDFELAVGVAAGIAALLRSSWHLGLWIGSLLAVASCILLRWSPEPLSYLVYSAYILVVESLGYAAVYFGYIRQRRKIELALRDKQR